ncbi:MAG: hypothetical protein HY565_02600 [Candidatus Kerfeldbacteria bacterium]|nr:hypothetical protein [Candidatus Kerfeldbacteria bacterium]
MEPRPAPRRIERAERPFLNEASHRALLGLFALTTTACDPFSNYEDGEYHGRQEAFAEIAKAQAEAKTAKSPEALEAKTRADFKAKLVELEQAGYTVEISGINLMVDTTGPLSGQTLTDLEQLQQSLSYSSSGESGAKIVETATDPFLVLQQQIAETEKRTTKKVDVPIYQLKLKPTTTGITLTVTNWLTNETVTSADITALNSTTDDYTTWHGKYDAQLHDVLQAIQQDKAKLAKTYSQLLTDHGVSLNAMDIMRTHPGQGMETITRLFENEDVQRVAINGFKHNTLAKNSPFIAWEFEAGETAELLTTGSPELPGTLTSVELRRSNYDTKPDWWHGKPISETFTDQYGNLVIVETTVSNKAYEHSGEQDEAYSQMISIMVPTNFLDTMGRETEALSWSVDLSKLGIPEMTDLVYSHPERPVLTKELQFGFKFNVYYQGEDAQTENVYDGFYDAAMRGSLEMQYAFYGFDPEQQLTKNILIVPTNGEKNGYFTARNSATIALTDAHMNVRESDHAEVMSTARHETGHALFNHLRLGESQAIRDLHKRLSKDFFKAIDESNWETNGFGGHSQDNATEFFASFMNGIMEYRLEDKLRAKLTPATAAEYADACKTVREALTKPLKQANGPYESIDILIKLTEGERIANDIVAGH